jgi:hypothetical protein
MTERRLTIQLEFHPEIAKENQEITLYFNFARVEHRSAGLGLLAEARTGVARLQGTKCMWQSWQAESLMFQRSGLLRGCRVARFDCVTATVSH